MSSVVIFAFDPVDELEGRSGVIVCAGDLAGRLIAEHRAEDLESHRNESMRYVTGSAANLEAAAALRASRGLVAVRRVQVRQRPAKTARLER
jgi:hypothetical protein